MLSHLAMWLHWHLSQWKSSSSRLRFCRCGYGLCVRNAMFHVRYDCFQSDAKSRTPDYTVSQWSLQLISEYHIMVWNGMWSSTDMWCFIIQIHEDVFEIVCAIFWYVQYIQPVIHLLFIRPLLTVPPIEHGQKTWASFLCLYECTHQHPEV